MQARTIGARERIGSATDNPRRWRRGMASRTSPADRALKQLQQALENALKHAESLRNGASKNSQKAVRDLEKRIRELRTELNKNSKSWISEAQEAVGSAASKVPGVGGRTARKPAASR